MDDSARIIDVTDSPPRMDAVRVLFMAYAKDIGIDLGFQGFEKELNELPGCYALPFGRILLAEAEREVVGCVALRPINESTGEVKRLFVRPKFRGQGLARDLASEIVTLGFHSGYRRLLLDTLGSMTAARKLYESLGFTETEPYYDNPLPNVVYYELDFHKAARSYVAKHARKLGTGQWGVTLQNDDMTTMDEVVSLIQRFCRYDFELAESLMRLTHLHGSAIIKRVDSRDEAQEFVMRMDTACVHESIPLKIVIYKIPDHFMQ